MGIRPKMMHGTISGAFCGSERICFTILLWNFSSFSRFFLSGVITSRPYNKVGTTYVFIMCIQVLGSSPLLT